MDTLEAIAARHSVREYSDRPVDRATIEKMIDAARRSPTARNEQPWEFVAVTDAAMRQRIAALTDFGKFIAQAPACIAAFCRDTKYYLKDGAAATTTLMIAAAALGVGTCWVAGDKKAYCSTVAQMLGVPDGFKLIALVAVGYEARPTGPKQKRPVAEVLHWEKYA